MSSTGVEDSNDGTNVFVVGLRPITREKDLLEIAQKYGSVLSCDLIIDPHSEESRGFAFVKMQTHDEANALIGALNGSKIDGARITARISRRGGPRPSTPGRYLGGNTRVHGGPLPGHSIDPYLRPPPRDPYRDPYYRDPYYDPYYRRDPYYPPSPPRAYDRERYDHYLREPYESRRYDDPYYDPYYRRDPYPPMPPRPRPYPSDPYPRRDLAHYPTPREPYPTKQKTANTSPSSTTAQPASSSMAPALSSVPVYPPSGPLLRPQMATYPDYNRSAQQSAPTTYDSYPLAYPAQNW